MLFGVQLDEVIQGDIDRGHIYFLTRINKGMRPDLIVPKRRTVYTPSKYTSSKNISCRFARHGDYYSRYYTERFID